MHQLAVLESSTGQQWDTVFLCALIGDDDLRIYRLNRHPQLMQLIEQRVCAFWHDHVETRVPPPGLIAGEEILKLLPRVIRKSTTIDAGLWQTFTTTKEAAEHAKEEEMRDVARLRLAAPAWNRQADRLGWEAVSV